MSQTQKAHRSGWAILKAKIKTHLLIIGIHPKIFLLIAALECLFFVLLKGGFLW